MSIDPKSINQINIFKNDYPVGTLQRTKSGCQIEFSPEFKDAFSTLTFKISTKEAIYKYKGAGLPPYFAGLLPEGLRLRSLIRKLKTSPDDLFSLLAATSGETIGDIHFRTEVEATELEEIPNDFKLIRAQLKKGIDPGGNALAGIQDKISADRISLPLNLKKKNKSYILKLSSLEHPDIIYNEHICLGIARKCGLNVNKSNIVMDHKQQDALLVERFDRLWDKDGKKWTRFHQEDACQILDRYPGDKYLIPFQDIADEIGQLATSPEIEILNLMKLKAFSYLIGNGDLHAKNISLTRKLDSDVVTLTPFYDIVCTAVYGDQKMALMMLGKNENLKRKTFVDFGKRYRIPDAAINSMLDKLTKQFFANYQKIFSVPVALKKRKFLESFFEERLKHLEK